MIIPSPRTWVDGELVSPQMLNTEIRDNLGYILSPPGLSVASDNSAFTLPGNDTPTYLPYNLVDFDNDGMYDPNNKDTFTVQTPGIWSLTASISIETHATGFRGLAFHITSPIGGTATWAENIITAGTGSGPRTTLIANLTTRFWAGDKIRVVARQTSGVALRCPEQTAVRARNQFGARWLGA